MSSESQTVQYDWSKEYWKRDGERDKAANLSRSQVTYHSSCPDKEDLHLRKIPGEVWRMDCRRMNKGGEIRQYTVVRIPSLNGGPN